MNVTDTATAVLVAHQRRDIGSCICGWSVLGASYARHVVEQLAAAGVLAAADPDVGRQRDLLLNACEQISDAWDGFCGTADDMDVVTRAVGTVRLAIEACGEVPSL